MCAESVVHMPSEEGAKRARMLAVIDAFPLVWGGESVVCDGVKVRMQFIPNCVTVAVYCAYCYP